MIEVESRNKRWNGPRAYRAPTGLWRSLGLLRPSFGNETWDAGGHHGIQALPGLNSIDFVERVFGKARDIEIFFGAGRGLGRSEHCGAALHRPR